MRDLVIDRVRHRGSQPLRRAARPNERATEDRDLARRRRSVGGEPRARHSLVEPVQPVRADEVELFTRGLVLDDDGDTAELVAKRLGQRLEGVDDHAFDVVVGRLPGEHRQTLAGPWRTGARTRSMDYPCEVSTMRWAIVTMICQATSGCSARKGLNSHSVRPTQVTSVSAVTVAVRTLSAVSSAISPNQSPGPRRRTSRPPMVTVALPSRTM